MKGTKTPDDSSVLIVKAVENPLSKQAKDKNSAVGTRSPKIAFNVLLNLYYDSFVTAWLTNKIATAINSGFKTQDEKLLKVINSIDHEFLDRNKIICWNAFFEVIRQGDGTVVELIPILSNTIEIMEDGDGYLQTVGTEKVYFNAFTPLKEREARKTIYAGSGAGEKELKNTGKWCGFNPNLNEVYHFKNTSIQTKYYGASYYEAVVDQLVLIENIDKYYLNAFEKGMIKAKLLYSDNEKKTFSATDKDTLKEFIKQKMKWLAKSHSVAIVDHKIGQLDLEHDVDAKAFLEYRVQLLQSVSITLNVPYDMLLSDNSNRASSQVSMESFNNFTIWPAQQQNIKDFKILFGENYKVDDLDYNFIDTKDEKEEMDVLTGYKKAWVMTANEVRAKLGLPNIDWGDVLIADTQQQQQQDALSSIMKTEAGKFYKNLNDLENDLLSHLQNKNPQGAK